MLLQMSHNGIGDALCDLGLKNWLIPIYEFHIHSAHEFMVQMLHVSLALTWNCYKHAVSSISCNVLHILLEVKLLVYLRTRRIVSITPWYANYVHKNKLDPLYSINTPQIHSRYAAFLSMAAKAILSSFSEKRFVTAKLIELTSLQTWFARRKHAVCQAAPGWPRWRHVVVEIHPIPSISRIVVHKLNYKQVNYM